MNVKLRKILTAVLTLCMIFTTVHVGLKAKADGTLSCTVVADDGLTVAVSSGDNRRLAVTGSGVNAEVFISESGQEGAVGSASVSGSTGTLSINTEGTKEYVINYNGGIKLVLASDGTTPVNRGTKITGGESFKVVKDEGPGGSGGGSEQDVKEVYGKIGSVEFTITAPTGAGAWTATITSGTVTKDFLKKLENSAGADLVFTGYKKKSDGSPVNYSPALTAATKEADGEHTVLAIHDVGKEPYSNGSVRTISIESPGVMNGDSVAESYNFPYITNVTFFTNDASGVKVTQPKVPWMYDTTVFSDTVEMGTTASTAPELDVYYGNTNVVIDKIGAGTVTNIEVAPGQKIAAGAISINNATHTVTFNSPYYNSVKFKVTAGGNTGYIQLNRVGIAIDDLKVFNNWAAHGSQRADVAIPAAQKKAANIIGTYYYDGAGDYDMVATLTYANGTKEVKVIEDYGVSNGDAGGTLKCKDFVIWGGAVADAPVKVSVTAVKAGAMTGGNFGGASFGAGMGVTSNITKLPGGTNLKFTTAE